ncbi:MAG TPA: alpha/beta hydrolase [Acidimicrobiia bacterium]|nr:alpha/beta hydrolase [Acidimicrobiia bacterium]
MGTFTFDGRAVSYLDEGAGGPAVVFVHGFPFRGAMWEPQLPVVAAAGHRVVVPDLPGFGASDVPGDRAWYSIDRYADLVAALVSDLGLGPVVLAGLSMGGYIALAVARRHPGVLAGLVLADTRADPDSPEGRQGRSEQQEILDRAGSVEPLVEGLLNRVLGEDSLARADAAARLAPMMRQTAPAGWGGALEAMKNRPDQTELLGSIAVPTLVIAGESDAIAPVPVAEAMAKAIPGARFEVVPRAGHMANLENPGVFNQILTDFLAIGRSNP